MTKINTFAFGPLRENEISSIELHSNENLEEQYAVKIQDVTNYTAEQFYSTILNENREFCILVDVKNLIEQNQDSLS